MRWVYVWVVPAPFQLALLDLTTKRTIPTDIKHIKPIINFTFSAATTTTKPHTYISNMNSPRASVDSQKRGSQDSGNRRPVSPDQPHVGHQLPRSNFLANHIITR